MQLRRCALGPAFVILLGACTDTTGLGAGDAGGGNGGAGGSSVGGSGSGTDSFHPQVLDAFHETDGGPRLGEFGDPCVSGRDCRSGYCVDSPGDIPRICTQTCGECPAEFECVLITNGGADRTFLCIYDEPGVCKPCQQDRDCKHNEDLCLQIGNGHYCGSDCTSRECPHGYECIDIGGEGDAGVIARQCVPLHGEDCLPCQDDDNDGYGNGDGCKGFDCDDDDPDTYVDAPELCDDKDNNCNSQTDEANLLEAAPVDMICLDEGVCLGTRVTCVNGGWTCAYPSSFEAGLETLCDGLDNDCDGTADEDINLQTDPVNCGRCGSRCTYPHAEGVCEGASCRLGACEQGFNNANRDNGDGCEYACLPTNGGVEICDNIDNNCDGLMDPDVFDVATDPENCGRCGHPCDLQHAEPHCVDSVCLADLCELGWVDLDTRPETGCEFECTYSNEGVEICDDVDNDCDGVVDDGFDKDNSLEHCGGCGIICAFRNGVAQCEHGQCSMIGCADYYYDPDMSAETGCEYNCVPTFEGVEQCDGRDNDCDVDIDEDFDLQTDAENCGACGRSCGGGFFRNGIGACVEAGCVLAGCIDGFHDANNSAVDGCEYQCDVTNGGIEVCDNRDNDCDDLIDEDFDLLSDVNNCGLCENACLLDHATPRCAGGSCFISECDDGYYDFLPDIPGCESACTPNNGGVEACDDLDNDCDGLVDEDFDFAHSPEHCGFCDNACVYQGAQGICDAGECRLSGCLPGQYDLDGNAGNGCEYACQFQADLDLPDMNGVDENCDGIDGTIGFAIFVATTGNDGNPGTKDRPLLTVSAGLAAAARQARPQVLVSAGIYRETVTLRDGISLFGGYRAEQGWARVMDPASTTLAGGTRGLIAENISAETWVQLFTIQSANAAANQSSYGVYARDVAAGRLILSHNVIIAGNGGDGSNGTGGGAGSSGLVGGQGGAGSDGGSGGGFGGPGGGSACRDGGSGGRGGYDGANSTAGSPGTGGANGGAAVGTGCSLRGNNGAGGLAGGAGSNGAGGNGSGRVAGDLWDGTPGSDGARGGDGGAGGGASGGGGSTACTSCGVPCDLWVGCVCNADRGGGGGGGGGGGCGGDAGTGGRAGGGSFGVFLVRASILMEGNAVQAGAGGDGGSSGTGGNGGSGGGGGGGGSGADDSGAGGTGGPGASGGRGGHGGGGSGGVSYALYTSASNPTVRGDNQLAPGASGVGGGSQGIRGTNGTAAARN